MQYDNPAGRLLAILIAVKAAEKTADARTVWRQTLQTAKGTTEPALAAKVAAVMQLSYQAVEMLGEEHPELANPPPSWAEAVTGAFMVHNMHGAISSFADNISPEVLSNLRVTAFLLDKGTNRKLLSSEDLAQIKSQINEIIEDLLKSDSIPLDIKAYLINALRKIISSIDDYRLHGAAAIVAAIEETFGHAAMDAKYRTFMTDNELGQRILDALSAASAIVTLGTGLPVLGHEVAKFITGG